MSHKKPAATIWAIQAPVPPLTLPFLGTVRYFVKSKGNVMSGMRAMRADAKSLTCVLTVPFVQPSVVTADPDLARAVLMSQGKYPDRGEDGVWHWAKIFRDRGWPAGIPWVTGEAWRHQRRALNATLAQVPTMEPFYPHIRRTAARFAENVSRGVVASHEARPRLTFPGGIKGLASQATFEAVLPILTGLRADVLGEGELRNRTVTLTTTPTARNDGNGETPPPPFQFDVPGRVILQLLRAPEAVFTSTGVVDANPLARFFPSRGYRDLEKSWEGVRESTSAILGPMFGYYREHQRWPAGVEDSSVIVRIYDEVLQGRITAEEAMWVVGQALVAAVDTTSQSMENLLLNLALSPAAQDGIVEEAAASRCAAAAVADYPCLVHEAPWLRACVKESLRLLPVVPIHARELQADFEYSSPRYAEPIRIPKGTRVLIDWYSMARDQELVAGPVSSLAFDPRRFMRDAQRTPPSPAAMPLSACPLAADRDVVPISANSSGDVCPYHVHPHAATPFGVGARRCAGAGFATVTLLSLTWTLLKTQRLSLSADPPHYSMVGFMRPETPVSAGIIYSPR